MTKTFLQSRSGRLEHFFELHNFEGLEMYDFREALRLDDRELTTFDDLGTTEES